MESPLQSLFSFLKATYAEFHKYTQHGRQNEIDLNIFCHNAAIEIFNLPISSNNILPSTNSLLRIITPHIQSDDPLTSLLITYPAFITQYTANNSLGKVKFILVVKDTEKKTNKKILDIPNGALQEHLDSATRLSDISTKFYNRARFSIEEQLHIIDTLGNRTPPTHKQIIEIVNEEIDRLKKMQLDEWDAQMKNIIELVE